MPSQRLVKILDPLGHVPAYPALTATAAKAVVWAATADQGWITQGLTAAGVIALRATSFRHVVSSLHPDAKPWIALAVIDFDGIAALDLGSIISARWAGFVGILIAVSRQPVPDRLRMTAGIDATVSPTIGGESFGDTVVRLIR